MNETETLNETETGTTNGPIPLQPVPAARVPVHSAPVQAEPAADADDDDAASDRAVIAGTVIEDGAEEDEDEAEEAPVGEGTTLQDVPVEDRAVKDPAIQDAAVEDRTTPDVAVKERAVEDRAVKDPAIRDTVIGQAPAKTARPSAVGYEGPLLADTEELRSDWQRIKGGFVDNPRASVAQAETVLDEAADRLIAALRARQDRTRDTWDRDGRDTESLRQALLTYQALFNRITDL